MIKLKKWMKKSYPKRSSLFEIGTILLLQSSIRSEGKNRRIRDSDSRALWHRLAGD